MKGNDNKLNGVSVLMRHIVSEHPYRFTVVIVSKTVASFSHGLAVALLVPVLTLLTGAANTGQPTGALLRFMQSLLTVVHLPVTLGSLLLLIMAIATAEGAVKFFEQIFTRRLMGD